ncbi:MAG: diguanylate cyclase [Planctomycetota bacterium]
METNASNIPEPAETPEVLLVDDSELVHRLLAARLRQEDLELRCCFDGPAAIESAVEDPPALILLDLEMPEMDGFEVLRRLKDDARTRDVPVIVLSGLDGSDDKVTAFDLGAVDYITKPFALVELRVRVRSALRLNRLLQMLAQRAQVDGLSGLWNRTHFDESWNIAVEASARYERGLSLALFDLDHFKSINDTFGHPAGDAVIQGFAQLIQKVVRKSDLACRYGGEEFAVIMPETDPEEAARMCERVRQSLEEMTWRAHPERNVTVSIGIAGTATPIPLPATDWLERADKTLYDAKRGGRNRAEVTDLGGTVGISKAG